ncbi:hypothetical protein BP6252_13486 [Coleophoma cylindrospora]|uniref:Rhodanese domain-containing protein n=1 Tax=Coleophoma cylindrospora TaxID=1849047 RepID=A0A3D8Q8B1_9HELO|nr:hypothetical protein BP6252_13486 [Coleophoma cylindrospora]
MSAVQLKQRRSSNMGWRWMLQVTGRSRSRRSSSSSRAEQKPGEVRETNKHLRHREIFVLTSTTTPLDLLEDELRTRSHSHSPASLSVCQANGSEAVANSKESHLWVRSLPDPNAIEVLLPGLLGKQDIFVRRDQESGRATKSGTRHNWYYRSSYRILQPANVVLTDVREPSELNSTGRIPSSISIPVGSTPDSFFITEEEFEDRFGYPRPGTDKEVIFYCKAGVRSRAAAELARQAGWKKIGEYPGSWLDWSQKGGPSEK